jgi:hypothetical protein
MSSRRSESNQDHPHDGGAGEESNNATFPGGRIRPMDRLSDNHANASAAARQALPSQLSSTAPLAGMANNPDQSNAALGIYQFLSQRAGAATFPSFGAAPGVEGMLYSRLSQQPLTQGFATPAEASLREAQANLREANLRLLIAQQRRQQQQQHQQQQQPQFQPFASAFAAANAGYNSAGLDLQIPLSHLQVANTQSSSAIAGAEAPHSTTEWVLAMRRRASGSAPLPSFPLQANGDDLTQWLGVNPSGSAALAEALRVQQQHIQGAASELATGNAQLPTQRHEEGQQEMKDAEYFDLFGFNDEDGVQIINETFPSKLYRMLFEVSGSASS